jgi:hypothetical protein
MFALKIDELGHRRLQVDATLCAKFKAVRSRKLIIYDSVNKGPWTIVKRFAVALYGYHNNQALHARTPGLNLQVYRSFSIQEMRQRYSHEGYTIFYDVIANRINKDQIVIPAFIVIYSASDINLVDSKKTAQILLWDAISSAETLGVHRPWTLPAAESDAAMRELQTTFRGARDLRKFLRRQYIRHTWTYAVLKAALLQTNWLLRGDGQLIDLIQTCAKDQSKYLWVETRCRHKARVYILQVMPEWRAPRIWLDNRSLWRAVYDEVTRALSVAIAVRHPRLEGVWLWAWKVGQFFRSVGLEQNNEE